jgi:proteasome-associated ATPase
MVDAVIDRTYALAPENEFLEVTYANGDKEIMYFKDFMSGAMIENIVSRAKKAALKSELETGVRGITLEQMMTACYDEFRENEDLPNTTNPDDWARISGKKGERIAFMRTLIHGTVGVESGRSIDTTVPANPYV